LRQLVQGRREGFKDEEAKMDNETAGTQSAVLE